MMLASVQFPGFAVQSANLALTTYTTGDTYGSKYSAGGWHLPLNMTPSPTGAAAMLWRKQTVDLSGLTRQQDMALLPMNFVTSQSGFAKANGSPGGQIFVYDLTLITTEPLREDPDDGWLPPSSFPTNCGFMGGPMDPERTLYGEMRVRASHSTMPGQILTPVETDRWGSGEIIACDEIFCYRIVLIASDGNESATTFQVIVPPMNIQIPLMDADLGDLSQVMQLYRNLGNSIDSERAGAI